MKNFKNKFSAFSLIELLITTIVISMIMSALAPVITKRMKTQQVSVVVAEDAGCKNPSLDNCKSCPDGQRCFACEKGYYLNNEACRDCSVKFANCSSCTKNECEECMDGFYLVMSEDGYPVCQPCTQNGNCKKCELNSCIRCKDGYYKDELTGECISCEDEYGEHCIECSDEKCFDCEGGYNLNVYGECES